MNTLNDFVSLGDNAILMSISTAEGVRNYLLREEDVRRVRLELLEGAASIEDVTEFVRGLLRDFKRGGRSPLDVVLSAVVAAIEVLPSTAVDEFLEDLARVRIAELPMAPRVARLSLRAREKRIVQETMREVHYAEPLPDASNEIAATTVFRNDASVAEDTLELQEV